jgi:hypothetical protein
MYEAEAFIACYSYGPHILTLSHWYHLHYEGSSYINEGVH